MPNELNNYTSNFTSPIFCSLGCCVSLPFASACQQKNEFLKSSEHALCLNFCFKSLLLVLIGCANSSSVDNLHVVDDNVEQQCNPLKPLVMIMHTCSSAHERIEVYVTWITMKTSNCNLATYHFFKVKNNEQVDFN